jgi:hypothetical protein
MNPNVLVAAITAAGSIVIAVTALLRNYRGFSMLEGRISTLEHSLDVRISTLERSFERRLDVIEADLKRFFGVQAQHDGEIARLKDKTGLR